MINVFQVGVHIGMSTNAGQVLSTLLAQLTGVHVAANRLNGALGNVRTAAIGAGAAFAGWEVIKGLMAATRHAEKLNHELVKLQTGARLTDAQTEAARVDAFRVSRAIPGTEAHELTKQRRELFGVLGNMDEANKILPMVAQGSRAVGNFVDKDTDLAQIAIRALELRGHITKDHKINPEEFKTEFNAMVRSIVASEGLVDPQKLFMFIKQAGPAARTMSADTMWGQMPAIMNALGSAPAGTAMMSLFQQFVGHVVAGKRVAVAMESAGMLTHGKWGVGKGGKVEMDHDAVPDQAGFMDHPVEWLHAKLEAMRAKPGVDAQRIIQEIFQLSSRATSARLISDIDANYAIIQNEKSRFQRTPNPDVIAKEQNEKDLSVNIHNLSAAWNNFMAALGGPGIPIAISVLHGLTGALNFMQAGIVAHPELATAMFGLAGGLAALTVLGGSLAILNVCWAPLAAGLGMLIGIGPALVATGTGLSAFAVGLGSIVAILATPAAAAALAARIMKPSATNVGEEKTPGYNDRFGDKDPNIGRTSPYVPPSSSGDGTGKRSGDVYLDGKKVGMIINGHMANSLSGPPTGRSGADMRVSPLMPGMSSAFG